MIPRLEPEVAHGFLGLGVRGLEFSGFARWGLVEVLICRRQQKLPS